MSAPHEIFDRRLHRQRRERSAGSIAGADFLLREAADRLAERLADIKRFFPLALELGCRHGATAEALHATGRIGELIQADLAPSLAARAPSPFRLAADEEWLPFAEQSLDAVISPWSLHWVNDLPGALAQIRRALRPDGLFLAALPGPRSLQELRATLLEVAAEQAGGGLSPRLSPFAEVRDAGGLLQRAGFALPVADSEIVTVYYRDPLRALRELQAMGETNCLCERQQGLTGKGFWPKVAERYAARYALADGRLPATVEMVFLTGWTPHASQQQPSKRGSGQVPLGEALG